MKYRMEEAWWMAETLDTGKGKSVGEKCGLEGDQMLTLSSQSRQCRKIGTFGATHRILFIPLSYGPEPSVVIICPLVLCAYMHVDS